VEASSGFRGRATELSACEEPAGTNGLGVGAGVAACLVTVFAVVGCAVFWPALTAGKSLLSDQRLPVSWLIPVMAERADPGTAVSCPTGGSPDDCA